MSDWSSGQNFAIILMMQHNTNYDHTYLETLVLHTAADSLQYEELQVHIYRRYPMCMSVQLLLMMQPYRNSSSI